MIKEQIWSIQTNINDIKGKVNDCNAFKFKVKTLEGELGQLKEKVEEKFRYLDEVE